MEENSLANLTKNLVGNMIFQAEKKDIKAAAGDSFLKSVFNFDYN